MVDTISISQEFLKEIISHCKGIYPNEACGLLAGKTNIVERVYKTTNTILSSVNYEMDPKEQLKCEKEIRGAGLKVIGIYHSHPSSSAYPSQLDIVRVHWPGDPDMPLYPDACYMIIGPIDGDIKVRVFRIDSKQKINDIKLNTT